jgi:hypothetical protein
MRDGLSLPDSPFQPDEKRTKLFHPALLGAKAKPVHCNLLAVALITFV